MNHSQKRLSLTLTNYQILYWRIIGINYCNEQSETNANKFTFYNPSLDVSNIIWLRSDSGLIKTSNLISGWQDISGSDNDAWQMNAAEQPIFLDSISVLNYKPILRFDGLNDFMGIYDNNSLDFNDEFTMIFISKQTVATSDKAYICKWNYLVQSSWAVQTGTPGGVKAFIANTQTDIGVNYVQTTNASLDLGKYNIYTIKYDGNQSTNNRIKMYFNISPLSITTSGTIVSTLLNSTADLKIGTFEGLSRFFNGEFAEILLYNRALSDLERYHAEQYLHYKYAPPVNLGADIYTQNFCPVIIEASDRYIDYYWNTPDISPGNISDIVVSRSGQYSVTVTDVFGFTSTDTINVHFPEEIRDTSFCANDSIILTSPFSGNYTYLWSNLSTTEQTVFYNGGTCWLETTDDSLCSRRDTFIIEVDSISYIASLGNDTSLCSGNFMLLQSGQQDVVSYLWSPGGETTSSIVLNNNGGWYGLTVTSANACTATDSIYISIHGTAPTATFTMQNQCFGDSLVFTDASWPNDSSNIIQWDWIFHDGQTLSGDSVVKKKYAAPGIYSATLTIGTDSSCSASVTLQVLVYHLPVPDFELGNPCSDHPIQFYNYSSVQGGAHITDYLWIVNDTNTYNITAPVYNAGGPGVVTVYLNATSNYGCENDTTMTFEIKQSPLAQFDISPSCSERKTYFFDLSESTVVHPIWKWDWDFGVAGAVSEMQNPDYTYTLPGNYNVTLQVINLYGCPDQDSGIVQVSASPRAGFLGDTACVGVPVQLADTSVVDNGHIYQRTWDIPALGSFSDSVINVIFNQSGNFEVSLEVISELNCKDEVTGIINVFPLPEAAFTVSENLGPFPLTAEFTNGSDPGSYFWDFGDNSGSQLENPVHIYADTGSFQVVLSVTDANGCVQQAGQTIRVVQNIYDLAILFMDTIVNGNLRNIEIWIANMGTLPVQNPYLLVKLPNSQPFSETVNLTLEPGDTPYYIMTTGIYVNEAIDRSFICAEIMLPPAYGIDVNESNNEYCLTSGNDFSLLRIYPNPAKDGIIIEFSSGSNTDADIIINTVRGQKILQQNVAVQKGYNRINLDISTYTAGVYFLSIRHKDGVTIDKFVRSE